MFSEGGGANVDLALSVTAKECSGRSLWQGVVIAYFRTYSGIGPFGALRIAVFANHTTEMVDQLVASLAAAL